MKLKVILTAAACVLGAACFAQDGEALKPFTSICMQESAIGFNWRNGKWEQANFRPTRRLIVQKLDFATLSKKSGLEKPVFCKEEQAFLYDGGHISSGCYLIKDSSTKSLPFVDAKMCREEFTRGVLQSIACEKLTFKPDGSFIELPWHNDISDKPKNDYKDSLVLSVGTCTRLEN